MGEGNISTIVTWLKVPDVIWDEFMDWVQSIGLGENFADDLCLKESEDISADEYGVYHQQPVVYFDDPEWVAFDSDLSTKLEPYFNDIQSCRFTKFAPESQGGCRVKIEYLCCDLGSAAQRPPLISGAEPCDSPLLLTFVATADLHAHFEKLPKLDGCAFLVLAGDIADRPDNCDALTSAAVSTAEWSETLPVVYVSGGHDFLLKENGGPRRLDEEVERILPTSSMGFFCLDDRNPTVELSGLKIGGIPWIEPQHQDRYVKYVNDHQERLTQCDILIMHCPPANIGIPSARQSVALYNALDNLRPKIAICGHKHGRAGKFKHPFCPVYNVAETFSYFDGSLELTRQIHF